MAQLKVVYKDIDELKEYENNPRVISQQAIDVVANSIKEFGITNPVLIDKNNIIVAGHTRVKACRQVGVRDIPTIYLEDLSEEQIRAYRLVDNKTGEFTDWDLDMLDEELNDILNIDMDDFGFGQDVDDLVSGLESDEVEEVNTPDIPEEPVTKSGDIYQLGRHRLMCGDSMDAHDVNILMDGKKADMVFTDPPYGVSYQSNKRVKTDKFDIIDNDDVILDVCPILKEACDGWIYLCTSWKVLDKWMDKFKDNFELTNMVIWYKGGGGIGDLKHTFVSDYEVILVSNQGKEIMGKRIGSVWEVSKDSANDYVHPTQKPVGLPAKAIVNSSRKGCAVLDLFGGSGSTLMACEQTDRTCYTMELDPKYCDVIIKRWEDYTGEKAIRMN